MFQCKRFFSNESGNIIILAAASISVLVLATGGAIDYTRYLRAKSGFNNAIDQALIAAVTEHARGGDLNETAERYFNANFPTSLGKVDLSTLTVTETSQTTWTASARGKLETSMLHIVGIDDLTLTHTAKATVDNKTRIEAVFLADTSSSMCMDIKRDVNEAGVFRISYTPDNSCKKLRALKDSLNYIIDNGLAAFPAADGGAVYNIGIVPFNHKVKLPKLGNIPTPLSHIEATHTKGDPSYYTNFDDANPLSPVVSLRALNNQNDKDALHKAVDDIVQTPTGKGWTRSNIATLTAALMLDPDYYSSFDGVPPAPFNAGTEKVVVMMTDGANVGCCFAAHPEGNFNKQYLYLYEVDNAHLTGIENAPHAAWLRDWNTRGAYGTPTKGICDQLKAQGVKIYTVTYDVNDNDPGGKEIKDAYRYCASSDTAFYDVTDINGLMEAYKSIASSFQRLRISY